MPIRKELRHFYGAAWRKEIRPRILERENHRCKFCGRQNHAIDGSARIVLTIAHLNHNPADNRPENLAALCQRCHLNHDKEQHRETRKARKDAQRPLLAAAGEKLS